MINFVYNSRNNLNTNCLDREPKVKFLAINRIGYPVIFGNWFEQLFLIVPQMYKLNAYDG